MPTPATPATGPGAAAASAGASAAGGSAPGGPLLGAASFGALPHAAPELIVGLAPPPPGPASDIYSLGVVLWELVACGAAPFGGLNAAQILVAKKRRGGTRNALRFPDGIDAGYARLCRDCWVEHPDSRPSAWDMVSGDGGGGTRTLGEGGQGHLGRLSGGGGEVAEAEAASLLRRRR